MKIKKFNENFDEPGNEKWSDLLDLAAEYYVDGLTPEEVSQELDIPLSYIKKLFKKWRKKEKDMENREND